MMKADAQKIQAPEPPSMGGSSCEVFPSFSSAAWSSRVPVDDWADSTFTRLPEWPYSGEGKGIFSSASIVEEGWPGTCKFLAGECGVLRERDEDDTQEDTVARKLLAWSWALLDTRKGLTALTQCVQHSQQRTSARQPLVARQHPRIKLKSGFSTPRSSRHSASRSMKLVYVVLHDTILHITGYECSQL